MSAHTPGPWEWRNNRYGELRLFGPDNRQVLGVDDQCSSTKSEAHVEPWGDDDASLIAAAPELLRCLSMAIQDIEQEARGHRPLGFSDGGALHSRLELYKATIAKAGGR